MRKVQDSEPSPPAPVMTLAYDFCHEGTSYGVETVEEGAVLECGGSRGCVLSVSGDGLRTQRRERSVFIDAGR